MRVGIFGGSFDPVHYGHLLLAECCREQCRLDQIRFIPAATSPHKLGRQPTANEHRIEMLKLATGGHPQFEVSAMELERGGVSYTVDTLEALVAAEPEQQWVLLMGADTLADLPNWRYPQRICALAQIAVVERPQSPPAHLDVLRSLVAADRWGVAPPLRVRMPQFDISGTELRERSAAGQSLRYRLPPAVELYIATHRVYGGQESAAPSTREP